MKLKPNILDEINSDPTADCAVSSPVSELASMVSQSDSVVLEDESGRVTLNLTADGIPKEDKAAENKTTDAGKTRQPRPSSSEEENNQVPTDEGQAMEGRCTSFILSSVSTGLTEVVRLLR